MSDTPIEAALAVSAGSFRCGARAMREAIAERLRVDGFQSVGRVLDMPIPTPPERPLAPPADWQWWAGNNDEWYGSGPHASREEAIAEGRTCYGPEDTLHIIEAVRHDVRFTGSRLIEDQYFEADDLFDFDNTEPDRVGGADEIAAADDELQALLDAWTARWRHTFADPTIFAASRNHEVLPGETATAEQAHDAA